MKRKYVVLGIFVLLIAAVTAMVAHAQMRHMGGWGWPHGEQAFIQHLTKRYDLTEAQQAEVKQLWQAEKPTIMPLVQQLAQGHNQMVAATANGTFDEVKVSGIAKSQAQTLAQLMVEKERLTAKFYTILTPEQRTRFDSMRQRQISHIDRFLQKMATNQSQ